jgi:hypothetical protein
VGFLSASQEVLYSMELVNPEIIFLTVCQPNEDDEGDGENCIIGAS